MRWYVIPVVSAVLFGVYKFFGGGTPTPELPTELTEIGKLLPSSQPGKNQFAVLILSFDVQKNKWVEKKPWTAVASNLNTIVSNEGKLSKPALPIRMGKPNDNKSNVDYAVVEKLLTKKNTWALRRIVYGQGINYIL